MKKKNTNHEGLYKKKVSTETGIFNIFKSYLFLYKKENK
jgi:hypothetical protein